MSKMTCLNCGYDKFQMDPPQGVVDYSRLPRPNLPTGGHEAPDLNYPMHANAAPGAFDRDVTPVTICSGCYATPDQECLCVPVELVEEVTEAAEAFDQAYRDTGKIDFSVENSGPIASGPVLVKHDSGKPDLSLLPLDTLTAVAEVMTFGAKKYSRDGWRKGSRADINRYLAAVLRHLAARQRGEQLDPESGLTHLAHATCSLMMALGLDISTPP